MQNINYRDADIPASRYFDNPEQIIKDAAKVTAVAVIVAGVVYGPRQVVRQLSLKAVSFLRNNIPTILTGTTLLALYQAKDYFYPVNHHLYHQNGLMQIQIDPNRVQRTQHFEDGTNEVYLVIEQS